MRLGTVTIGQTGFQYVALRKKCHAVFLSKYNMKKKYFLLFALIAQAVLHGQSLTGTLTAHPFQEITLEGFNHFEPFELGTTQADSLGNFSLNYSKDYKGMALLKTHDKNSLVVLLSGEPIQLKGTHITEIDSLWFNESQNKTFFDYALAHSNRKSALRAWHYLDELYQNTEIFAPQKKLRKTLSTEIERLNKQEQSHINSLPTNSYLRWFIPYRTFLQEMHTIIRTETERIPASIALFRTTDFNHPYWKTSGILQEFIEKHYFLLENSSGSVAEKQEKMNKSSLYLVQNLQTNPLLLDLVVEKLFNFLEERSLYIASKYLANRVLNDVQCEIQEPTANKLEKYRNLKVGVKAPDIQLSTTMRLSDYQQPVLLVFGKSDCSHCKDGLQELRRYYGNWKTKKNVEVVYVSLDNDEAAYQQAYQNVPWPMFCDFKGWESNAAKAYHIWGTPTYLFLDKDLPILSHINSVAHANAWVEQRL